MLMLNIFKSLCLLLLKKNVKDSLGKEWYKYMGTSAISANYIRTVTCGLNAAIEVLRDEVDALIL